MSSPYNDHFINNLPENIFDGLDIDALTSFPEELGGDIDIEDLIRESETVLSVLPETAPSVERKNSTLVSLLKTVPLSGCVPPAPQISLENNSVIESKPRHPSQVQFLKDEKHPQLKHALVEEKPVSETSQSTTCDSVDGSSVGSFQYVVTPPNSSANTQAQTYEPVVYEIKPSPSVEFAKTTGRQLLFSLLKYRWKARSEVATQRY